MLLAGQPLHQFFQFRPGEGSAPSFPKGETHRHPGRVGPGGQPQVDLIEQQ